MALHLFLLVPVGCGMEIAEEQTLRADAYEETLNWLYDTERREQDLQLRATCAPHYFRVVRQRQAASGRENSTRLPAYGAATRARAAWRRSAERSTLPLADAWRGPESASFRIRAKCTAADTCRWKRAICGTPTLADIWQTSEFFADLRDLDELKGKCGRCGYAKVCGGCRARAYGSTGDYLAEEPFCAYRAGRPCRRSCGRLRTPGWGLDLTIVLVGLSQRTAPVALRERLSSGPGAVGCITATRLPRRLPWWGSGFRESALLSTCNRLEVYAVPDGGTHGDACARIIVERLAELSDVPRSELEPHIYHQEDERRGLASAPRGLRPGLSAAGRDPDPGSGLPGVRLGQVEGDIRSPAHLPVLARRPRGQEGPDRRLR